MVSKVKTKNANTIVKSFLVMVLIACMLFASVSTASAVDSSPEVTGVKESLVQVRMVYNTDDVKYVIQSGTGFLINVNTVVTCFHVVTPDDEVTDLLKELFGNKYNKNNLSLEIVVKGDVTIGLTE